MKAHPSTPHRVEPQRPRVECTRRNWVVTRIGRLALCALMPALVIGCGGNVTVEGTGSEGPSDDDGTVMQASYPDGPYGIEVGEVVANASLVGYADPTLGVGPDFQSQIHLEDFYNPNGNGNYPEGSPFGAGSPKPRALVLVVGAIWTGSVKALAVEILNGEHAPLRQAGGELLFVLGDGIQPGNAADIDNLDNWVVTFESQYPAAIDPSRTITDQLEMSGFPQTLLIDPRTMEVVEAQPGIVDDGFWDQAMQLAK